jgi:hypothetical protein
MLAYPMMQRNSQLEGSTKPGEAHTALPGCWEATAVCEQLCWLIHIGSNPDVLRKLELKLELARKGLKTQSPKEVCDPAKISRVATKG